MIILLLALLKQKFHSSQSKEWEIVLIYCYQFVWSRGEPPRIKMRHVNAELLEVWLEWLSSLLFTGFKIMQHLQLRTLQSLSPQRPHNSLCRNSHFPTLFIKNPALREVKFPRSPRYTLAGPGLKARASDSKCFPLYKPYLLTLAKLTYFWQKGNPMIRTQWKMLTYISISMSISISSIFVAIHSQS